MSGAAQTTAGSSGGAPTTGAPLSGTPAGTTVPGTGCFTMSYVIGATPMRLSEMPATGSGLVIRETFEMTPIGSDVYGMVEFDGRWWMCASNRVVMLDAATGDIQHLQRECWGLTRIGNRLAVDLNSEFDGGVGYYETREQVVQDNRVATVVEPWEGFTNAAVYGGTLITGGGPQSALRRWDLQTGLERPPLELENFDTWVMGFALLNGSRLFVLDSGQATGTTWVHEFDPDTGQHLGQTDVGDPLADVIRGLWCPP